MKNISTKQIITILVVVLIVIAAIFAVKSKISKEENLPTAAIYPVTVTTIKPIAQNEVLTLSYLAQVENDNDVELASNFNARVLFIKPTGSYVKKGEVVVRLDNTNIATTEVSLSAQIKSAQVELKNLEASHKRTKELLDIKGASVEQFQMEEGQIEAVKSKIKSLQQNNISANNNQSYATITAPIDGILSKSNVSVGDISMAGKPIANISAKNGFFLIMRLPADISVYGIQYKGNEYPVTKLNSTLNNLLEYKTVVPLESLTTGDRLDVNVITHKGNGLKLPFDAILNREGKSYVFVKEKNAAKPVEVMISKSGEDGVIVSNNELSGKEIIVAKQDILLKILSGAIINIVNQK